MGLKEYPLEIRFLIIAGWCGLFFAILTGIANYFLELGNVMIATSIGTGIVGLSVLYFSLVKRSFKAPTYFGLLSIILILYPFMWFENGGSRGPMIYFMLVNAVFCSVFLAYVNHKIVIIVQLLVLYALLYLEHYFPGAVTPYKDELTRSIDLGFSFSIVFLIIFFMLGRIMSEYNHNIKELEKVKTDLLKSNQKLTIISNTDELTGIHNRRHIMSALNEQLLLKKSQNVSLILLDIDHFKRINDTYSHSVGDEVLKKVSDVLRNNVRKTDILARIGGEEFLVVLPDTSLDDAYKKAEKLRVSVETLSWKYKEMQITISGGIYCNSCDETLDELLENVDQRLYRSKHRGRNCISR
ncbi:GGDEF domain-containing protein [Shewanella youngdeokensis]|uniref:diguanylate cyclase n=1 Tax=Shewanella youngdeokensis TaxID=2999068 RepID=A0ABZ0JTH3_9GAMM|nr:GGDEF domain-containing protein [Shewanella sp. DAU334]